MIRAISAVAAALVLAILGNAYVLATYSILPFYPLW